MIKRIKSQLYQFLRKTQKYTETDNIYLVKGGFWLSLGQVISTFASFLLAIAFANLLDPVIYGNYKYILSLVGILAIFSLPGIGTAITQATARNLEGSFYSGFKTKLKWGLLGSLVALGLASYYWLRGNYLLPIPLLISAAFLPLMQASQIYASFLAGRKLFHIQVKYSSLNQIICVGAMISALFLTKNLFWLIAVYFVSHTFLNYFFYLVTQRKSQPNRKEDPQTLSYGKHLSLMGVISNLAGRLDSILLFTLLGSTQLAVYSFAIAPISQVGGIKRIIDRLAFPKFSQKSREKIKKNIFKKMFKLSVALAVLAGVYIFIAPYFYQIFFPQYLESVPYSQVFAITLIFPPLGGVFLTTQMAIKQKYILSTFGGLSNIILMAILVLFYGIWGIVMGGIMARFLTFLLVVYFVKKL